MVGLLISVVESEPVALRKGKFAIIATIAGFALTAGSLLSGCETAQTQRKPLRAYPEWSEYRACLTKMAVEYASQAGSPLELGAIAVSACSGKRMALIDATAKQEGPYFARGVNEASQQEDPKFVAQIILKIRSGQPGG